MHLLRDASWMKHGTTLLWDPAALSRVAKPEEVVSMRQLCGLACRWPEVLPSANGNMLVVAGVEGCLDSLSLDDAARWLEEDLRPLLHSFQNEYEGQAALVLWLPSGRQRIHMTPATGSYRFQCAPQRTTLELGRLLFAGAEQDVRRIIISTDPRADVDGETWVGLYQRWIS